MNLSEKFAFLTRPDPKLVDIDNENDDTGAKLVEKNEDEDWLDVTSSKLRRQCLGVFSEGDDDAQRYAGALVSRKNMEEQIRSSDSEASANEIEDLSEASDNEIEDLFGASSNDSEALSEDDQDRDDNEEKDFQHSSEQNKTRSFSFTDDGDYSKYDDEYDENESETEEDRSESETEEDQSNSEHEMMDTENATDTSVVINDDQVQKFSSTNAEEELLKGKATKAQLGLCDTLFEMRIKLQKAVIAANQLPQASNVGRFVAEGGEHFKQAQTMCEGAMTQLLTQLVQLQSLLLLQCPETQKQVSKTAEGSDDEVTSDDQHTEDGSSEVGDVICQQLKRKLTASQIPEVLAKRHKSFQEYRNRTIQKWCDKTRVASGKLKKGFTAFETSALKQIEQVLSDKDRLIKRTQLKRSVYRVLGKRDDVDKQESGSEVEDTEQQQRLLKTTTKDYDPEIFDDDDFYHQLLRELIKNKTTETNDPIALSRHWLQVQKLRSKTKSKVDTKASKGRKLRYDVHSKLVNFMAPFDNCTWTDQSRNDVYSSLFGGLQKSEGSCKQTTET